MSLAAVSQEDGARMLCTLPSLPVPRTRAFHCCLIAEDARDRGTLLPAPSPNLVSADRVMQNPRAKWFRFLVLSTLCSHLCANCICECAMARYAPLPHSTRPTPPPFWHVSLFLFFPACAHTEVSVGPTFPLPLCRHLTSYDNMPTARSQRQTIPIPDLSCWG